MFSILLLTLFAHLAQSAQEFDILKYGAVHDGVHKNTEAIGKAIAAAAAAPGGGIVHFPKGHYFTGPIHLKSNVTLKMDEGVVLKFSDNFDDYLPFVKVRDGGIDFLTFSPLIYADGVHNIAITGKATLDGSGEKWWNYTRHLKAEHKKTGKFNTNGTKWQIEFNKVNAHLIKNAKEITGEEGDGLAEGFFRPHFFHVLNSQHITLEGLTFLNSPAWTVHPAYSDHIRFDHLTVKSPHDSPNTDGIDPDSCRHVAITNCFVSVGDDCVCIKSGKDKMGRQVNRPSENITISDCVMHSGHGGLVIGSEMSGGVRGVYARNLHFEGTDKGVRIKSTRGRGGVVEDVHIENITMKGVQQEGVTINSYYTKAPEEPFSERTPIFRNIFLTNVTGSSKLGIQLRGLPEKHFDNIQFKDVHITAHQDMVVEYADHVVKVNVTTKIDKNV